MSWLGVCPGLAGIGRRLIGLTVVVGIAFGGLLPAPASSVEAGADFCANDPVIVFDTEVTDITMTLPLKALRQVNASNPVILRVYVPSNVRPNLTLGVSVFAQRVEFVQTAPASGPEMTITFEIFAPDGGPDTRYTFSYRATSRLEIKTGQFTSGSWGSATFRVPYH